MSSLPPSLASVAYLKFQRCCKTGNVVLLPCVDRFGMDILSFVTVICGVSWAVFSLAMPISLQTVIFCELITYSSCSFYHRLFVIMWFLFGGVSSASWCLRLGCVILLWHSLGLPRSYFYEADLSAVTGTRHSVSCFGVRFSVMFHFMFVHYTFSSVWVAEWPPFGK